MGERHRNGAWIVARGAALAVVVALGSAALSGCSKSDEPKKAEDAGAEVARRVMVASYPTQYFAERIAGGLVPVENPVPGDADPATWEPPAEAISAYQSSALVVLNGAGFEEWAQRAPLPRSRVVESASAFSDEWIEIEEGVSHSHGTRGEHTHTGTDGHTWLDPINAIAQSAEIAEAMSAAFPEHAGAFAENQAALARDLRALDASLREVSEQMEGWGLVANHPAYNYLARRYGWEISNLDVSPEHDDPGQVAAMAGAHLVADGGEVARAIMLWESEPTEAIRAELRKPAWNIEPVVFSPTETKPEHGDYLDAMRANVERLRAVVGRGAGGGD